LPEDAGRRVFHGLSLLAYGALPRLRAVVAANQAKVLGLPPDDARVRAMTRDAFALYGRYWHESFLVARWSDERIRARFTCDGYEHLQRALESGRGAITALPHMGNWDAAGRWMAVVGTPVVSVAEELRPAELFELFVQHRRELGMGIIGLSSNGRVGNQLAIVLSENRVVALVADRDLSGRGVEVEMFGETRRMPAGPALLSITTGAALIPAPIYTTERGWRCVMQEPIVVDPSGDRRADARALTQKLAEAFERAIAASPADWHMFQPAWGT
jgi:KDO2-lipid IV(A) lauroyltransferase